MSEGKPDYKAIEDVSEKNDNLELMEAKLDKLPGEIARVKEARAIYYKLVTERREKRKALMLEGQNAVDIQLTLVDHSCRAAMANGSSCPDMLDDAQEECLRLLDMIRTVKEERRNL